MSGIGRQIETIINKLNEGQRERFNLKDAHLEVRQDHLLLVLLIFFNLQKPIRAEVAKVYVNSLQRQISDEQLAVSRY